MLNAEWKASQTFNDFNIGQLLNFLDNNSKDSIRKLEKLNKNLVNTKYGSLFNKISIKEGLFSNYTNVFMNIYKSNKMWNFPTF